MIRADTDECNLTIEIRNRNDSCAVRVTCAAVMGQRATGVVEHADRKRLQSMEKYDQPVYPRPKSMRPHGSWPPWLVHIQGSRLRIEDATGPVGPAYLKTTYATSLDRPAIQSFYEDLLTANGYTVDSRSLGSLPVSRRVWLQGSGYPDGRPGRRCVIRIELTPAGKGTSVELRVIEFP